MEYSNIEVAKDELYESVSWPRKIFNRFITGIFSNIPFFVAKLVIRSSNKKAAEVHKNVTTHEALDTLYTSGLKFNFRFNLVKEAIEHIWFNLNNPKAVRNRLKLVINILSDIVNKKINNEEQIIFVSLASGSARAIIDVLSKVKKNYNKISLFLIDKNKKALEASAELIEKKELNNNVTYKLINDNVRNFINHIHSDKPNIIEMVGLLDYLDNNKSHLIISKIYNALEPGGIFITANIRNNSEKKFLENALRWHMVYREPGDLIKILVAAGFDKNNISVTLEPLKIHFVAVAIK